MTETSTIPDSYEWSYPVDVNKISEDGLRLDIEAPENTYSALCKRLNLENIRVIKAQIRLDRNAVTKVLHVKGDLVADVDQICVVTGDPVAEKIQDSFESWYAEPSEAVSFTKVKRERMKTKEREDQPMLEEFDDPEEIIDGKINIGELATQFLSLSLTPYPKSPGARGNFGEPLEDAPDGTYNNPFAALKEWKIKEKEKSKE